MTILYILFGSENRACAVCERIEQIMGHRNGGSILCHRGTNNARKYLNLLKTAGMLPVFGGSSQRYRNSRRMSINGLVQHCVRKRKSDLWNYFVAQEDVYLRDTRHVSGEGAAVCADRLKRAVDSELSNVFKLGGKILRGKNKYQSGHEDSSSKR